MNNVRDVFVFDYGRVPRTSVEESLAGDMSRTLALAQLLRDELSGRLAISVSAPELEEEYGVVLWLAASSGGSALRSLVLEPIGGPYTWALRVDEKAGCAGLLVPRVTNPEFLEAIKQAVDAATHAHLNDFRNARWLTRSEYRELRRNA